MPAGNPGSAGPILRPGAHDGRPDAARPLPPLRTGTTPGPSLWYIRQGAPSDPTRNPRPAPIGARARPHGRPPPRTPASPNTTPAAGTGTPPIAAQGDHELDARARRHSLAAAIACISAFAVTVSFASPLLSLILEARGVDRTTIGLMAAMPAFAILVTTPLVPAVVARIGLRTFLFACIASEFVLFLLLPVFDHLPAWFAIRALMGVSSAGLFVASETWINAVALDRHRGRVLAVYSMILSGSFALGPLIIPLTGTEGWAPFLAGSAFVAGAALPMLFARRLSPVFEGASSFNVLSFLWIAPTLAAAIWLSSFKEMSSAALLPVFGVRSGLPEHDAAMMLSAAALGALLLQLPIGWAADHANRYAVLFACAAAGAIGLAFLPALVQIGGAALWLGLLLWGGLFSGVYTAAMALVGQRFRGAELVTANAAFGFLWGLGSLTGPPLTGVAMDLRDPDGFPELMLGVTLLFLVLAALRRIHVRRRRGRPG